MPRWQPFVAHDAVRIGWTAAENETLAFAHVQARVRSVRGGNVDVELKLPDGTYTDPITVMPDPSARVRIGGRNYRWRDLSRGQELDVWVPPDRFEIAVPEDPEQQFAAAPAIAVLVISEPTTTVAANTLPRTASLVPLVGALGALLAALGLGVVAIRRRFS